MGMKLYITRHGQTDWNLNQKIQGKVDIPLNETGRNQARVTRDRLADVKLDVIFSSPLLRAFETAQIINEAHQLAIIKDLRLEERGFGDMEGAALDTMDFTNFWKPEKEALFPNCEATSSFYMRVHNFIEELKEYDSDQSILIVAHGGVSLPFYTYFHTMPEAEDMREYMLGNCEVACYRL